MQILAFFISISEFSNLFELKKRNVILKSLIELDGIGETQVEAINNFFSNSKNTKIILNLIKKLNIADYIQKNIHGVFSNKKLMFTGGFKNISRSEAKSIAENNGGKVLGSVSKKRYLIVKSTKKR